MKNNFINWLNRSTATTGLPWYLTMVFALLSVWLMGMLFWQMWGLFSHQPNTPSNALSAQEMRFSNPSLVGKTENIIQSRWFGQLPMTTVATENTITTPTNNINSNNLLDDLVIKGILYMPYAGKSRALIMLKNPPADGSRAERSYANGEEVPVNSSRFITYIGKDHVMFLVNGQKMRLELLSPSEQLAQANAQVNMSNNNLTNNINNNINNNMPLGGVVGSLSGNEPPVSLRDVRQNLLQQPGKISEYIRGQPVKDEKGNIRGYRVYPGSNRSAFQQSGLQPGDVVLSVNGTVLSDPSKNAQLLQSLSQISSANLSIERAGMPQNLTISVQ